ncbi:5-amino-6-(D-ribitylamino)uracil--L-tyrosine 4-hydroxyphenyl transferase CofH [Pseudomonas thivervalensis]|uniref:5-amino-6-(D-ribitylamino)uracil--L-tyrosine 4-hydroxyphenyl transferase CofH n=1 Tax=Pseudomonas thivervalensis TaxID=86265 RepID=UPI003D6AFD0D
MRELTHILQAAASGALPTSEQALALADYDDMPELMAVASSIRDRGSRNVVTYSRKVFLPLTRLCRDVCHYCTFSRQSPSVDSAYLTLEQMLETAHQGARLGCKEALFTLGEKPELRYKAAREALTRLGFASTIDYVVHAAETVHRETGLLPHINAGCLTEEELTKLRPVAASMGLMLESASERLCEPGMPHHGSPDKHPAPRLATLEAAGRLNVPMTSGILIGIGETRLERIEALLALRDIHARHGHLQEIIVQNFRAKPGTLMADNYEPSLDDLCWTIAMARIVFGGDMGIQAPPNLSPQGLQKIVASGINDWGGISPLTADFVNPEAPWPHLEQLERDTRAAGKHLQERLTIYPCYAADTARWVDPGLRVAVMHGIDAEGLARTDNWIAGGALQPPAAEISRLRVPEPALVSPDIAEILRQATAGQLLSEKDIVRLLQARGEDFTQVCYSADKLRSQQCGESVGFVVNRNINYTNICTFSCSFCAFSKGGKRSHRGSAYDLDSAEIAQRVREAWDQGATEVCMQGGIHPSYTGETYLRILRTVKEAAPLIHIHAFSPLEIWQGAQTLGLTLSDYLSQLKEAGLGTLPGTAAEILDDEVRATLCPDKINTQQWLEVMRCAHGLGIRTTATIMFGHLERLEHVARHLMRVRDLAAETAGITEFVPLPFVHMESPLFTRGKARKGPTFREALLMHAVARLALHPHIRNVQASWVKLGPTGVQAALYTGVNDVGGTLMNESITRSAGAVHGQEMTRDELSALVETHQRVARQRTTLYETPSVERLSANKTPPEQHITLVAVT